MHLAHNLNQDIKNHYVVYEIFKHMPTSLNTFSEKYAVDLHNTGESEFL